MSYLEIKTALIINIFTVIILITALSLTLNNTTFYVIAAASVLAELSILISIIHKGKRIN